MESPIIFLGDTRQRSYSSSLRISISRVGTANTKEGRVQRILRSRGAFKFLPVLCSNDLVHGSWWMVWGSLLSAIMPIVPLIDIYCPLFHVPEGTVLAEFGKALTWILCIISGICFTVGSAVYVRAFEDPPLRPLLENFYHFQTDELLASWLFLFAMLPAVPYSLLYLIPFPYDLNYIGYFMTSLLFIAGSLFFVYTCYPSSKGENHETHSELLLPIFRLIFGSKSSILKHVQTDWLAATWFMFWATFFCTLGSYFLIFYAQNDRQLFVYITGFTDSLLFLIGSAYYVSGSYPQEEVNKTLNYDDIATRSRNNTTEPMRSLKSPSSQKYSLADHEVINPIHDDELKVKRLSIIEEGNEEGNEQDETEMIYETNITLYTCT